MAAAETACRASDRESRLLWKGSQCLNAGGNALSSFIHLKGVSRCIVSDAATWGTAFRFLLLSNIEGPPHAV
jgi:hypothetical protein